MPSSAMPNIERITLVNHNDLQVVIANYGARILSIKYRNGSGQWIETTQNFSTDEEILNDDFYMGATCGRVSNRISNASYSHEGVNYVLAANDGGNTLHGGPRGFSHCMWSLGPVITDAHSQSLTLSCLSKDGDQGFPGNLTANVTYKLTHDNQLLIEYFASSDKVGPINMCNHAYFTLGESSINNLTLSVNANKLLALNSNNIPTGEILTTNNTHFCKAPKSVSETLKHRDADDCYIIEQKPNHGEAALACTLASHANGITLSIYSNQTALQVYTGNYLPLKHSAIALEAQGLVDAVNQASFETDWVGPNQDYRKVVRYQFMPS